MSFDDALSALLPLLGERVEVQVWGRDDGELIAHFRGMLREGWPLVAEVATHEERIGLRLDMGSEFAALSLDRAHYEDGEVTDQGVLVMRGSTVAIHVAKVGLA